MKSRVRHIAAKLKDQSGNALILVLVFLLLGSIMLVPVLDHVGTALKTGISYENKTDELYAADSGIEDGIWQIKYDGLQPLFGGDEAFDYDFSTNASYTIPDPINGLDTNVTIQNVWIPSNVTLDNLGLSAEDAKTIIDSEKLMVSGTSGATPGQPYHIKIEFVPAVGDNLTIKSVGAWLPQGFSFASGNSSLEEIGHTYTTTPTVSPHCGGEAIVWSYNPPYPLFTSFPNFVSSNGTMTSTIDFSYTPPATDPTKMPTGIAWVTTEMHDAGGNPKGDPYSTENVPISWDVDTRIYKIISEAADTTIEAYSSKCELRDLNDAISGDYLAIGNSLMTDDNYDHIKDHLHSSSSTIVSSIPEDADVIGAYLYWSGFSHYTTIFSDYCSNFDNWNRSNDDANQTRVPTGDGNSTGTWNYAPLWDDVDETSANDNDYMRGSGWYSSYQLFTFPQFSVPAGAEVTDLTIHIRAKDASYGTNNIRPCLKIGGNIRTNDFWGDNPGFGFTTYSYSYTVNPVTGSAWTAEDINGTGSNPLQQFGVFSSDLNPNVYVSMVYAEVKVNVVNYWTIYNNGFRGQGSASATTEQRTLTLNNGIDLSSYGSGTIGVTWDQDTGGTLESGDTLYYAFSGDGGNNWSSNFEAFHDDNPDTPFFATIPDAYMTTDFKMRFYFNFDSSYEYVYLDNIKLLYTPPDTSVTFSINSQQVYLDGSGDPQAGAQPLTASDSSVLLASGWGGYSYACHRDVSKLVKKYPILQGEEHHTGNAEYTVGDVQADPGEHVSYAGWSLIIIYFSPETAGHYLFLYDVFSMNPQSSNLDFDYDGQPGGEITNFIIPEPVRDRFGEITETVAARLTAFVGEGDDWLYGTIPNTDCIKITGQQSGNSKYLSNSASPDYNVWNSASPGMSYEGVDVDTFEVLWSENILTPNDTRLHLDLYSGQDFWNLIYFILSVRSKTVVGGTEHYNIMN